MGVARGTGNADARWTTGKVAMEAGYSLERGEARAPQRHPHCYHWRSRGCVEDRGTSEGQLHRAPWGWSCAQATARRRMDWLVSIASS